MAAVEAMMDLKGADGLTPRKKMAMGKSGAMSSDPFPHSGGLHPDASARTGDKGAMAESERAVGEGVKRAGGEPMAQQAPSHGPLNHSNVAFSRGGKL